LLEKGSATATTRVPGQVGFWFFVLQDALELHVARTLALIAAHADVQDRVRTEVRSVHPLSAQAIDELHYLEACVGEQLRLWTPVPILLRRAVKAFSLRGIAIESGHQLLIHSGHCHRDARFFGERADRFSPGAAPSAHAPVLFFSRHRQACAGQTLAMFLLKATLAALLGRFRFELIAPVIGSAYIPYSYDHFKIKLRTVPEVHPPAEQGLR
jgi:cytochrome P450